MTCTAATVADLIRGVQRGDGQAADRLCTCYAPELSRGAQRADPADPHAMSRALCATLLAAILTTPEAGAGEPMGPPSRGRGDARESSAGPRRDP